MTEAMPFLQKYDITFLRPPTICRGLCLVCHLRAWETTRSVSKSTGLASSAFARHYLRNLG